MITEESYRLIDAYIRDELSDIDRVKFEALLKDDEFVETLKVQQELYALHGSREEKNFLDSDENKHILEAIKQAESDYFKTKRTSRIKSMLWFSVAASIIVAVSIAIGFIFDKEPDLTSYYTAYADWDQLPSLTNRSEENNDLAIAEQAFKAEDFQKAISMFNAYRSKNPDNPQILVYLGAAYLEQGNDAMALQTFNLLANSDSIDSSRGLWYIALTHLKYERKDEAVTMLKKISSDPNNYNADKAKEILNKIL